MSLLGLVVLVLVVLVVLGGVPHGFGWYQGGPGTWGIGALVLVIVVVLLLTGRL